MTPVFDQLFAALWDLIFCSIIKMSTFAPDICSSLKDIFNGLIPAVDCTNVATGTRKRNR